MGNNHGSIGYKGFHGSIGYSIVTMIAWATRVDGKKVYNVGVRGIPARHTMAAWVTNNNGSMDHQ